MVFTMVKKKYITIPELAKILGVSRIAVYKKVKSGQIKAAKAGNTYLISEPEIAHILGKDVSKKGKASIEAAVKKVVKDYGSVLKKLGSE